MSYTWTRPVVNGGFCNVVAAGQNELFCGGDMFGTHRSEDAAGVWIPTNWGAGGIGDTYGRAVVASALHPGVGYYGVGTLKGGGGAFAVTQGAKFTKRSTQIAFGTSLPSGSAAAMPRPVGSMLDVMVSAGAEILMAASNKGIAQSNDEGHNWHILGGAGVIWKSIAMISATESLAAHWNQNGLAHVKGSAVTSIAAPGVIHDLRRIAGVVWAAGPGGIYQWNGTSLAKHPASSFFAHAVPSSIDGSADGKTIVVGCNNPGAQAAAVSHDGGVTWHWITHIVKTLWDGRHFWLDWANNIFGGSHYSVAMVAVDKANPNVIMFAGRNGIWGSRDGGQSVYPCGPGGAEDSTVKVGPGANEFACNDNDWIGIHTSDGWQTSTRISPAPGGGSSLAFSAAGHSYAIHKGATCDITKDGQSIADDVFRGMAAFAVCGGANAAGLVTVGLYGGGVLVGHP